MSGMAEQFQSAALFEPIRRYRRKFLRHDVGFDLTYVLIVISMHICDIYIYISVSSADWHSLIDSRDSSGRRHCDDTKGKRPTSGYS
jgi:hypothetical protein